MMRLSACKRLVPREMRLPVGLIYGHLVARLAWRSIQWRAWLGEARRGGRAIVASPLCVDPFSRCDEGREYCDDHRNRKKCDGGTVAIPPVKHKGALHSNMENVMRLAWFPAAKPSWRLPAERQFASLRARLRAWAMAATTPREITSDPASKRTINMRRGRGNQPNQANHKPLKWDRLRQWGKGGRMARYSDLKRDKLIADQARPEVQLNDAEPGPHRDRLERKLGQIRVALSLSGWACSPGLRTPE
jgi:hypothetical protein